MLRNRIAYPVWALVVCPAVGFTALWLTDPDGDTAWALLVFGVPPVLAIAGGAALRQPWWYIGAIVCFTTVISFIALLVLLALTQGN